MNTSRRLAAATTALLATTAAVGVAAAPAADAALSQPKPCVTAQLKVTTVAEDGAGGHSAVRLVFTNTSGHTCVLRGYPGVDMTRGGTTIHATRRTTGYFPAPSRVASVVLTPKQRAYAMVQGHTGNRPATCSATMTVTVPNMTATTRVPAHLGGCAGLQVSPVARG